MDKRCPSPLHPPIPEAVGRTGPEVPKSRRAGPAPQLLTQLGKRPFHLTDPEDVGVMAPPRTSTPSVMSSKVGGAGPVDSGL